MIDKHTGGPAFPVPAGCGEDQGMTLRDYFSGQWLAGHIANPGICSGTREDVATAAYAAKYNNDGKRCSERRHYGHLQER